MLLSPKHFLHWLSILWYRQRVQASEFLQNEVPRLAERVSASFLSSHMADQSFCGNGEVEMAWCHPETGKKEVSSDTETTSTFLWTLQSLEL